jgi:hypothetical protein
MRTGFGFAEPWGWVAVFSLPAILVIAALILFFHEQFAISTVSIATATLLVNSVAIFASLYKLVLGNQPQHSLRPTTTAPEPAVGTGDARTQPAAVEQHQVATANENVETTDPLAHEAEA